MPASIVNSCFIRKAGITPFKIKYGKLASTKERMHKSENAGKHKDVKEDGI